MNERNCEVGGNNTIVILKVCMVVDVWKLFGVC